jgi:hypothetical protein
MKTKWGKLSESKAKKRGNNGQGFRLNGPINIGSPCKLYFNTKKKYYKGPDTKLTLCEREDALIFISKTAAIQGIAGLVDMGYGRHGDWEVIPLHQ